jgi:hypothetical protein
MDLVKSDLRINGRLDGSSPQSRKTIIKKKEQHMIQSVIHYNLVTSAAYI